MPVPGKGEAALAADFLREHFENAPLPNALFAGKLAWTPEHPGLDGIRVLRMGLHLGEIKGKIFAPDHALALALTCKKRYPLEENEARAYQEGQVIPCSDGLRGWMTPVYQGLQLGWGKASGGQIKNHYPKGLRK